MSVIITFVAAVLIFGAVIAIHEFGHFSAAKLSGIQVNEYSIGMARPCSRKSWGAPSTPSGFCHRRLCGHGGGGQP